MSFKPDLALQDIPGFNRQMTDQRHGLGARYHGGPRLESYYTEDENSTGITLYDSNLYFDIAIKTLFNPAKSPDKPASKVRNQQAKISIYSDDTYEGYEHQPDHLEHQTDFGSIDPEKRAHSKIVLQALADKLEVGEVVDAPLGVRLEIPVGLSRNPFWREKLLDEITRTKEEIESIAAEYAEGKKPLGDINIPAWERKANPRPQKRRELNKLIAELPEADPTILATQVRQAAERKTAIKTRVKDYFPTDKPATKTQHGLFKDEVLKLFDITQHQLTAKPKLGEENDGYINAARYVVEKILRETLEHFPVDQPVTRASHINFERWMDETFKGPPGYEAGKN